MEPEPEVDGKQHGPGHEPERGTEHRFTTPRGEIEITARSLARDWLVSLYRLLAVAAAIGVILLLLTAVPLAVVVGDVSGHGVPSALLMATARALLRQRLSLPGDLAEAFSDVNSQLAQDVGASGQFMTLFVWPP